MNDSTIYFWNVTTIWWHNLQNDKALYIKVLGSNPPFKQNTMRNRKMQMSSMSLALLYVCEWPTVEELSQFLTIHLYCRWAYSQNVLEIFCAKGLFSYKSILNMFWYKITEKHLKKYIKSIQLATAKLLSVGHQCPTG